MWLIRVFPYLSIKNIINTSLVMLRHNCILDLFYDTIIFVTSKNWHDKNWHLEKRDASKPLLFISESL